ncbi:Aste57867_20431 [Aphanomyces stellatus]|uniref:Aste57867_20431 protein n=1 Tax=Aphanomyces stellatus TaxID=120398 RepID=A0A485LEZ5_9STRA|nr:hypothetical protein As57867_020365 [Aphanomyces stellatus]VFT97117.1 Aste57867_20431 [Aphanomyces stellatus]
MSVGVMSIRGSKFATSSSRNKHKGSSLHHRGAQSFARLNSLDYHDEIMDAYGGSYNYDFGVSTHQHESIQSQHAVVDDEQHESNLSMLISAFPDVDASIVHDIFLAKNFDLCGTAEALSGLMPTPAPPSAALVSAHLSDTDPDDDDGDDDGDWSFQDEADESASVGSVDWVVVPDEWEVVDANANSCRSYSAALLAPYGGPGTPFEVAPPATPLSRAASVTSTKATAAAKETQEENLCEDYYGIKEYGQRARLARRQSSKAKSVASKIMAAK